MLLYGKGGSRTAVACGNALEQERFLGLRIEHVHDLAGEGEVQLVAVGQAGALLIAQVDGGQAQDDLVLAIGGDVQVELGAHHFVDQDGGLDGTGGLFEADGGVLRTHAQDDVLRSDVLVHQLLELGAFHVDGGAQHVHVVAVSDLLQLGGDEVHLGCADEAGHEQVLGGVEDLL